MRTFGHFDEYDEDDLSNHHPTCRGGCGQLADECMCNWVFPPATKSGKVEPTEEPAWVSDHWM